MYTQQIRITALILLIMTAAWVVLMAISSAPIQPDWKDMDYARWAADRGAAYVLTYINASLLTLLVLPLFGYLYLHFEKQYRSTALGGLLFVPVYAVLNLVSYSIQIQAVPNVAQSALGGRESLQLTMQLIQILPGSLIGYLNGLAYGILAIPSILYGRILIKSSRPWSGGFLLANGLACVAGVAGYLTESQILSQGVVLGGILFLLSLLLMVIEFGRPPKAP